MEKIINLTIEWVYVTAQNEEEAEMLARTMVEEKYAACSNILGTIRSFYRWESKVNETTEIALIFKTKKETLPAFTNRLKELHSYECPCILSFSSSGGENNFMHWIHKQLMD